MNIAEEWARDMTEPQYMYILTRKCGRLKIFKKKKTKSFPKLA